MHNYSSESDQLAAKSTLSNIRNAMDHSNLKLLDVVVDGLSTLFDVSSSFLALFNLYF